MRVIRADVMGMCFGVRDALSVIDGISDPRGVTILGQLVHNEVVLDGLKARGFAMQAEAATARPPSAMPENALVVITAHGISDRRRQQLEGAGKTLVDTTCPLVLRAHHAARSLELQGYHVLVIGRRGHVEVQGITGDLTSYDVIESETDVRDFGRSRLGIICQTTVSERQAARIRAAIIAHNPDADIRYVDTICLPTKEHHRSLERLLERVDAMVVVGGRNSNNTRELVELCQHRGCPVVHVQSSTDLDAAWFKTYATVGLTAGTSTLEQTIDEVHRALVRIGFQNPESLAEPLKDPGDSSTAIPTAGTFAF